MGLTYNPPVFTQTSATPTYDIDTYPYLTLFTEDTALDKDGPGDYTFNVKVKIISQDMDNYEDLFDFDITYKAHFCGKDIGPNSMELLHVY